MTVKGKLLELIEDTEAATIAPLKTLIKGLPELLQDLARTWDSCVQKEGSVLRAISDKVSFTIIHLKTFFNIFDHSTAHMLFSGPVL